MNTFLEVLSKVQPLTSFSSNDVTYKAYKKTLNKNCFLETIKL